jgi:hypothetical protein
LKGCHAQKLELVHFNFQVLNGSQVDRVIFYQHEGWYTRNPGRYEVFESTHPISYVGKLRQGTYHDDGGSGTCCYFEDYRNPGTVRGGKIEIKLIRSPKGNV